MNKFDNVDFDNQVYFIKYVLRRFENNQKNNKNLLNSLLHDEEDLEIFNSILIFNDNNIINKIIEYINIKTNNFNPFYQKNNILLSNFEKLKYKKRYSNRNNIISR